MARVEHGQRHVDHVDERLPDLPDPHVPRSRGRHAEDIGGDLHPHVGELLAAVRQEVPDHLGAESSIPAREVGPPERRRGRVRETHVVPLDFREAHRRHLAREVDVIVPDLAVERVQPHRALVVRPSPARRVLHGQLGPRRREHRVLHDDDARDGVDLRFRQLPEQPGHAGDPDFLRRADLVGQRHRGPVTHIPGRVLDVDDEAVDFGARGQVDQRGHAPPRPRGPRVHIEAAYVLRAREEEVALGGGDGAVGRRPGEGVGIRIRLGLGCHGLDRSLLDRCSRDRRRGLRGGVGGPRRALGGALALAGYVVARDAARQKGHCEETRRKLFHGPI